jgi:hypothetical protein
MLICLLDACCITPHLAALPEGNFGRNWLYLVDLTSSTVVLFSTTLKPRVSEESSYPQISGRGTTYSYCMGAITSSNDHSDTDRATTVSRLLRTPRAG